MKKIKVGIIGGAGYTGGELLRILVNHPHVQIEFVHSNSNAGNPLHHVHTDLLGETDLLFTHQLSQAIDVLFLCVGHGDAKQFLDKNTFHEGIKIIDLSQDHRLAAAQNQFVYGLAEMNRDQIKQAQYIANPGCFATAIQLALVPLAAANKLNSDIHITAITGSTGAGQGLSASSHFSWRNNNVSVYKAFSHQHLNEIGESLVALQPHFNQEINFIPQRGDFSRGIFASIYMKSDITEEEAVHIYQEYYKNHPFTFVSEANIDLKQVVNTNKCLLYVKKHGNKLAVFSVIDNLLKGASGQAVQNMNLMFGLDESAGLKLKAVVF